MLGERTSKELVRTGTDSASVSALFTGLDEDTLSLLDQLSCPGRRTALASSSGTSAWRPLHLQINGAPATVSMLKQLGPGW